MEILTDNKFIVNKEICSEPFLGDTYFDMQFIFNSDIRNTDTIWEYIDDNSYTELKQN